MRTAILFGGILLMAAAWPAVSHDARRTGQTDVRGPRSASRVSSVVLSSEQSINMPVTIAEDGTVFAGTWGMVRSGGSNLVSDWNKMDGKLFSFDRHLTARWTSHLDRVPYCYNYPSRPPTDGCPGGGTVNGYNGTVEGMIALDPARGRFYVGRGDGKLFAVDGSTGAILWRFATFNPLDPADPEGGGEVVAGPIVGSDGTIYIATVAYGSYETNAVYAVSPAGTLLWRYPAAAKTLPQLVWATALSPDGKTLYVAGAWGPTGGEWDQRLRGAVYALDTADGQLKWTFQPVNESAWWKPTVWTEKIAVGSDGTIYGAGTEQTLGGGSAVLYALRDQGTKATYAWPRMIDVDYGRASMAGGIALRETGGVTRRVYATSGNPFFELFQSYAPGGKLVAVDAASGSLLWTFDPEVHGGTGAMTGIALDADGVLYTGASGRHDSGRVFAIREDGSLLFQYSLGGLLEWAHPVLGPFGDLYVADTRRCAINIYPVETGICNAVNVNPRIYAIWNDGPSRRRAVRH